jgi:hypothetical protein
MPCYAGALQHKLTPPVHFTLVILEMGSYKLFTWAGLDCDPPDLCLPSS